MSPYYAQCLILYSLILLLCLKKICSGVEWEGTVSEQQSKSEEAQRESNLVWGQKKARTARYEVPFQALEKVQSSKSEAKCKICRPDCPHWSSLDKKEKNTAYVMFYRKKQTKEQRQIRLANQSRFQRKYYANLSQVEKDKRKKAAVQNCRERIAIMTPEQKKAFYKKNRVSSFNDSSSTSREESPIAQSRSLTQLKRGENNMDLTPGWSLKRQRSKRLEISQSSSPSSSNHESDGDSWSITKEGAKVKLKDTKKPKIHEPMQSKIQNIGQGKDCSIHRPGCDHWDSLDRTEKNKHAKRWQNLNMSKAGRDKRNRRRREIYRLGGEEVSIARKEKQRMDRKKRRSKMSDKDYKDFLDRRNKYRRELRIRKQIGAPIQKNRGPRKNI